jgi:hypothetical protein
MRLETLLAVAAGAFAYHMYRKVQNLEELTEALATGNVVHLGALLDKADDGEDTEDGKFKFGFSK